MAKEISGLYNSLHLNNNKDCNDMTNKKTTAPANTDFFDFLWACGKFALIVYVLYRVTVALGVTPEGFF